MECSEIRLKLDEYIKNRLCRDVVDKVSFHLKDCPACFEEFNLLRELNDILNIERVVYPGAAFTHDIMNKISGENVNKKSLFNRFSIVNLGVSLVLTGLLTIFINTPYANGIISTCTNSVQYGAATINTSINATTDSVQSYITNILSLGGK